jgi:glycosyltransferase involved in cell wall biosynthesis
VGYFSRSRRTDNTVLYLALSGGKGQLIDGLYVVVARLLGHEIFVHHHSFAYIDRPTGLNRFLFKMLRRSNHIVLSAGMGQKLQQLYGLDHNRVRVVSNAALFPSVAAAGVGADAVRGPLRIGFLSNITFEKGIVEFFEVLRVLHTRGIAYEARIAGPVSAEVRPKFDQMLGAATKVDYVGPLYGEAKEQFYRELDVLLFPSKYINEAEPLVIHEALRAGVFTIASDRGAIAEILGNGAGLALPEKEFVESAARWLESRSEAGKLSDIRRACWQQALSIQNAAVTELDRVLQSMCTDNGALPG